MNYYIPVSSLNFTNILSSESISPFSFYLKRGYGFRRFEKISANPFDNYLLAYSKIPLIDLPVNERDEFPVYLEVAPALLKKYESVEVSNNITVLLIDSPVYINWSQNVFLVRNELERDKLRPSYERSLEVKFAEKYYSGIRIISDTDKSFNWLPEALDSISDRSTVNERELKNDQKLNKLRGFVYGYYAGKLKEQPKEIASAKVYLQEFINVFSGLMNEFSSNSFNNKKSVSRQSFSLNREIGILEDLSEKLITLVLNSKCFDEDKEFKKAYKLKDATIEDLRKNNYNNQSIYELLLSNLKKDLINNNGSRELLNRLIWKLKEFQDIQTSKGYQDVEELFQQVRVRLRQDIETRSGEISEEKVFKPLQIKISSHFSIESINIDSNSYNNKLYEVVINQWLKKINISSSDEIGQSRKDIIENIGIEIKALNLNTSEDLKYLRKFYQSLNTLGTGFNINDTKAVPLQALAFFISRYSENEKLKDFMDKNYFSHQSLVYGIWGAAYGYANTSKFILEPLAQKESHLEEVVNHLQQLFKKDVGVEKEVKKNIAIEEESPIHTQSWNFKAIEESTKGYGDNDKINFFERLLREEKKFEGKEDWIIAILQCYKEVLKFDCNSDLYEVQLFKDALNKEKGRLKQFGDQKVNLATEILGKVWEKLSKEQSKMISNSPNHI